MRRNGAVVPFTPATIKRSTDMQEIFNKVYNGLKSQSFMRSLTELMAAHDEAQDGYDMERLLRIIADKHGLKVPS